MNFLAHAYLSFGHKELLVGNMISDFVKGNALLHYAPGIQQGIRLHRQIDCFTDAHPVTQKAKSVFRADYRLFSGVITDILFDHFLATDPRLFTDASLLNFTQNIYEVLEEYTAHLPPQFLTAFTFMKMENWLYHYQYTKGVEKSLSGLVRRTSYLTDSATAYRLFLEHYAFLQQCYAEFFEDVKMFAKQQIELINP